MNNLLPIEQYATIAQATAHECVSDRYSFIPTIKPLAVLKEMGWEPFSVVEMRTRSEAKHGFQKHVVRCRNTNLPFIRGHIPEILIINSHQGGSSFQLLGGVFRIVCENGLVSGDKSVEYRIRHTGYTAELVAEAVKGIADTMPRIASNVETFSQIMLTAPEQRALAESAIELKYDAEAGVFAHPSDLIRPLRSQDSAPSLWNTFNTVQERLMKGRYRVQNSKGSHRARKITGVDSNLNINRALWMLTEKMAELKGVNIH